MLPNAQFAPCLNARGRTARVVGTLRPGELNDTMILHLTGFRRGLDVDLFTVQRSPQLRNGTPNPAFTGSFGLAWYQSDIHVGRRHRGTVTIHTILLDQIFGFDADTNLKPINT